MIQSEVIVLHFIAFVVMPITVETTISLNPSPTSQGNACNWKQQQWIMKVEVETKEYYYVLEKTSDTDNFFERKTRRR